MTPMTEDELARSLTAEGYPEGAVVRAEDMGPVERAYAEAMHEDCPDGPPHPFSDHSPWSGGDLDGTEPWPSFVDRLARHGLTLTAVADTAGEAAAREFVESISFVDTAGIDAAWREAEAALPEGWYLTLGDWAPEAGQTPTTRYEAFAQRYAARDSDDSFMERADSPAAALLALAAALRTPKPEGEPDHE